MRGESDKGLHVAEGIADDAGAWWGQNFGLGKKW